MYCRDCGEKLALRFLENEGLVPYCPKCEQFKFPYFPVAVLMLVVSRSENKCLLARHRGEDTFKLLAGYLKKGESAEKAIPRELKEETGLSALKWRYFGSRYQGEKDVLMLQFIVTADDEAPILLGEELEAARWCSPKEAQSLILKDSMAEAFLLSALETLGKKK